MHWHTRTAFFIIPSSSGADAAQADAGADDLASHVV